MSKLAARFNHLLSNGNRALITFITAGDPSIEDLPAILRVLDEAGADIIEVGIPFSDPIADGPIIQASSQRALDKGVTPTAVLEALRGCSVGAPIVLMGYYNSILRMGLASFADQSVRAGVSGVIVSDLTPEESGPWIEVCQSRGLDTVFLAAPTSTDERLVRIAACSRGFIYAVSRTGVTGTHKGASPDMNAAIDRIRRHTGLPIAVGFGISSPSQVEEVCRVADGAVVGSSLVSLIHQDWNASNGANLIFETVRKLKDATNLRASKHD